MHIAMLGRQPELGMAELERMYGAGVLTPLIDVGATLVDTDLQPTDLPHLGGSIKLAKVLTELDSTFWKDIEKYLSKTIPRQLKQLPEGKLRLGLSVYGFDVTPETINITNLRLKKIIRASGRSVRVVPNKTPALNSAQVIHNQLTGSVGCELLAIRNSRRTIIAQTIAEQDIDAYAARDQARPARDAFVGMLPPKLAQIMINLATSGRVLRDAQQSVILDPFCGTGVVLQEAALMGFALYGTDLSEKMIRYSDENMRWLQEKFGVRVELKLHEGDAMTTQWQKPIDAVVCEGYLGQPFSAPPSPEKLRQVQGNCDHIISEFLRNIGTQISSGTPLCIAVPAWRRSDGSLTHLPLIQRLGQIGYRRITFSHVDASKLLYFRPDQVVARELLILEKS